LWVEDRPCDVLKLGYDDGEVGDHGAGGIEDAQCNLRWCRDGMERRE
jgi:hypothetical protein